MNCQNHIKTEDHTVVDKPLSGAWNHYTPRSSVKHTTIRYKCGCAIDIGMFDASDADPFCNDHGLTIDKIVTIEQFL